MSTDTRPTVRVAYITTGYPYVSHTFIQGEVLALRDLGAEVHTYAVRRTEDKDVLSASDRREFAATYTLRPPRLGHYVAAHLRAIASRDARWGAGALRTLRLASFDPRSVVWRLLYFVQAVVLWDRMRSAGTTHVHAHFANVSSDLAMLVAEVGGDGWSWSFTMHGPTEFSDVTAFRLAEKTRSAQFVACISDFCRSQLMALVDERHWDKLAIVHCGIDLERFPPRRAERTAGPLRVLCVARMSPAKGQTVLLQALELLSRRGLDVETTFVGDGPDRDRLEEQVRAAGLAEQVHFAGSVSQDDIAAMFGASDVFCLPSFAEGVPVVLMEAMATGLPVICSRIAGIPELVVDGESGYVLPPGRADRLADAIEELASDHERGRRMGAAGRARIESGYEVRMNAEQLLARLSRTAQSMPWSSANSSSE